MSKQGQANEGIQATNVRADVLAVGRNAKAIKKISGDRGDLREALAELQRRIQALDLSGPAKSQIVENVAALKNAAETPGTAPADSRSRLQAVVGGLKTAGVILSEAASLTDPLTRIAGMLRVPLHLLGM